MGIGDSQKRNGSWGPEVSAAEKDQRARGEDLEEGARTSV